MTANPLLQLSGGKGDDTSDPSVHPLVPIRPSFGFTLLLGSLTALTALAIDMSLPALPQLQKTFSADVEHVQLTLSIFLFGFGVGQFLCGPISDHYGRRPVILFGLGIYVLSGIACAFATNLSMLVTLRLVQGTGASVGPILARAIVRDLFHSREGSAILSHITQVMVFAPMLAPTIGAYLLRYLGWESIFFTLAACGTVVIIACWMKLPETVTRKSGHVRIFEALSSYWLVISKLGTLRYVLAICFSAAGLFAYVSASPFVFSEVYRLKPEHFGFYFSLPALALLGGAAANRTMLRRMEPGQLLQRGIYLLLLAGTLIVIFNWFAPKSAVSVLVPMMIYMFGLALVMPNATVAALARHGAIAGAASSVIGAIQTMFSAASAYIVGAFYNQTPWSLAIVVAASAAITAAICRCEPRVRKAPMEGNAGIGPGAMP